jgi:hypothetical protein
MREQEVRKDPKRAGLPHPWNVALMEKAGLDPLDYVSWFPVPGTSITGREGIIPIGWWMPDPFPDLGFTPLPFMLMIAIDYFLRNDQP